jgi:hypothetical protein
VGETCVENGCEDGSTSRGFGAYNDCEDDLYFTNYVEPCDQIQPWSAGRKIMKCCCTDTK